MRKLLAATVLSLATAAAPASAASLYVRDGVLHYDAATHEVNYGGISHERDYFWLRDSVTVATDCEQNENPRDYTWDYRCRAAGVTSGSIRLGDQNDIFSARSDLPIELLGEEGDDQLDPALHGLADGGPGDDTISVDVGGSATLAGGPGEDTVVYEPTGYFPDGVRVSLDGQPGDGPPGAGGNVMPDVENVRGGSRGDVIVGSSAANVLSGGRNRDSISGRGGNDHIDASDFEVYSGARGPAVLYEQERDTVACGAGADRVVADIADAVARDCERVAVSALVPVDPEELSETSERPQPVLTIRNGSPRADRLSGTRKLANRIFGRSGNDHIVGGERRDALYGGAGSDTIRPGPGRDRVRAGAGTDVIAALDDGVRDDIRCGSGRDRAVVDRRDRVARDCESVRRR